MNRVRLSPLSLKTLSLALSASLATFIIFTASVFYYQRAHRLEDAHASARATVAQNAGALTQSLWDYDVPTLQAILGGMVQSGPIVAIELLEQGKPTVSAGRAARPSTADRTWTVDLRSPDGSRTIGTLSVSESYIDIQEQTRSAARLLAMAELFQLACLIAVLVFIIHRVITRHLSTLIGSVRQLGVISLDREVALRRGSNIRDELDDLVDALNRFRRGHAEEHQRRARAESVLRERISETETTLGALTSGVITLDRAGCLVYANPAALATLGIKADHSRGKHYRTLFTLFDEASGEDRTGLIGEVFSSHKEHFSRGSICMRPLHLGPFNAAIRLVPVRDPGDVAVIVVFWDITTEISRERQIEYQAFHDPLTGLGNRSLLTDRLPGEIARARSKGGRVAVLYVDLDNFKYVNDNLGHGVGDLLLKKLAERLTEHIVDPAWIIRYGGDEFVIVLPDPGNESTLSAYLDRLMSLIRDSYLISGSSLQVSCSIGISFFPEHGDGLNELISRADMGMFAAKKLGRNAYSIFNDKLQQHWQTRHVIANALKSALRSNELSLTYQPMIELATGRIVSAEVLLRWDCPQLGRVSPALFIPVAEETGLIIDIGEWVLRQAAATVRRWRGDVCGQIVLAVNVSALQFQSPRFMAALKSLTEESPEFCRLLTLEITETALAGDIRDLSEKLAEIRNLGFRIAIDDFGTGYSSLSYLRYLPVDTVKIDREFIRELHESPKAVAIVAAIIQLAKGLDFEVVAEGVEHPDGIRILTELQCDIAQGFYYSTPITEDDFISLLQRRHPRTPTMVAWI